MSGRCRNLPDGYVALLEGCGSNDVVFSAEARALLQRAADADQRAELADLLRRFTEQGPAGLPTEKWDGGLECYPSEKHADHVQLVAVRANGLAAYGYTCERYERLTLVITGVDPCAKKNKSPDPLRAAAGEEAFRTKPLIERKRRYP